MQIPILYFRKFSIRRRDRLGDRQSRFYRIIIDRKKKKNSQKCTEPETGAEYQYEYEYNPVQTSLFPKIFNS